MLRKNFMALMAVAVVGVALAAEQAHAGWWHHHRGYGSCGSSGGSWGSCGSSGGYYGYSSWGSSGGSWGSCGSSGGYYSGSCGSSGGSWGSCGSSGGNWGYSGHGAAAPANQPAPPAGQPAPPANPPTPPGPTEPAPGQSTMYHPTYGPMRNSALLSVKVPADAKVFVNDRATTSTGLDREYISRDLETGARYNYEVRAEFIRDGKSVSETKTVQLTAGQNAGLDFTGDVATVQTAAATEPRTTLVIHVPDDAKLFLAGQETHSTGPVREFSTNKLPSGSEWNTYAIRAVVERDGQQQVREESISLKAGESRDVTISFDSLAKDRVADTASR
ncbi:MAG TPA: TIGR03000 domain-containing protein [Pirellulales bacterium]|nr:TIGR03000 domain-containing protein [Pirellulales bacterium]